MHRRLVLACLAAGCHPYLAAGYEPTSSVSGPLAQMVTQPVSRARQTAAAAAPATSSTPHSYTVAVGFGVPDFGAEIGIHAHDVSSDSLAASGSTTYPTSPRYVTTTGSLDLRWTWLRSHHVSTYIHLGPSFGVVLDKSDSSTAIGQGVRYGAGIAVELPVIRLFVDASQTDLVLMSGPGTGFNELAGVMIGAALH